MAGVERLWIVDGILVLRIRGLVGRPRHRPKRLFADRGYDYDKYRCLLRARGITPKVARKGTAHGSGLGKTSPVQASGGLGDLYAPVLSLTAGDAERPGLLSCIKGLRFIRIEAFDTDAAVTATELLRFGHSWAAVHAIHAARPSAAHPTARFLPTLTPKAYAGTDVQAAHPSQ